MPFALVFIGLLLIVTGAKNTYREFGAELLSDFTGPGNFTYWIASIGAVGALGYIPALRDFSRLFLVLIIAAMLLSNRGVFDKFAGALATGPVSPQSENDSTKINNSQGFSIPATESNSDARGNFDTVMKGVKFLIGLGA